MKMKIKININEIVLDGFDTNIKNRINERKIVLAIEEELSRIFKDKDHMDSYKTDLSKINKTSENAKKSLSNPTDSKDFKGKRINSELSLVDAGNFDIAGKIINQDRIGIQIARSLYHTWQYDNNTKNNNKPITKK